MRTIFVATLFLVMAVPAFGQALIEGEDDQGVPRAARLRFIEGDVSFLRSGESQWAAAAQNLPLLAGDRIYTGSLARAEIQLGHESYVRLSEKTLLAIVELSEATTRLEIADGTALIRLGHLSEQFEVDVSGGTFFFERAGLYRVSADDRGANLIVRQGLAKALVDDGSLSIGEGQRLSIGRDGRIEVAGYDSLDEWDRWNSERDAEMRQLFSSGAPEEVLSYESSYRGFFGACDLGAYGIWSYVPPYGYCWIPRVSSGWAPYRYGRWIWIPAVGWTWLSNEPWGWAPYYYGRWVFINGLGWAWVPGIGSRHSYGRWYYWWRPALVYFFHCTTPHGEYVGWRPLAPGERWRRPDRDAQPRRRNNDGGITLVPISRFGRPDGSAPSRQLKPFIDNHERPGLPPVVSGRAHVAPVRTNAELRPVVTPPDELVKRPIVRPDPDSRARERRPSEATQSGDGTKPHHGRSNKSDEVVVVPPEGDSAHGRSKKAGASAEPPRSDEGTGDSARKRSKKRAGDEGGRRWEVIEPAPQPRHDGARPAKPHSEERDQARPSERKAPRPQHNEVERVEPRPKKGRDQ